MRTLTSTALAVTLTGAGLVTVAGQEPASRLALNIMALSTTTDVSELRLLDARGRRAGADQCTGAGVTAARRLAFGARP